MISRRAKLLLISGLFGLALVTGIALWLSGGNPSSEGRFSHQAFAKWLTANPNEQREFAAFSAYLTQQGVADAVPVWQLLRSDTKPHLLCQRPAFLLPPRPEWPNIVPVLRLVRDRIEPAVGQVEVVSTYRTLAFNGCVGGASQSRHLSFSAIDLIVPGQRDTRVLFGKLCAIHAKIGPKTQFGLGAYFDPLAARPNTVGRFHVDVSGYRSWGYSKHAASSGCRLLAITPAAAPSGPAAAR